MIATLTLNPALDKYLHAPQLIPDKKIRCSNMVIEPGGGGINASRGILELGGYSMAIYLSGGINGKILDELIKKRDIDAISINTEGNTRETIIINEEITGKEYKFVLPGPPLHDVVYDNVLEALNRLPETTYLVCSGSTPPNITDSFVSRFTDLIRRKRLKLILDSSGDFLKRFAKTIIYLMKPNVAELCSLANKTFLQPEEIRCFAMDLVKENTCTYLVVSLGASGALLATRDGIKEFHAPKIKKVSTTGAGDSMVAGLAFMLEKGYKIEEAVRFGVSCGSAATICTDTTHIFHREEALKLYKMSEKADHKQGMAY